MDDYIKLDGISSHEKCVYLVDWTLPLSGKRDRQTEVLPGRLTALESEYAQQQPTDVTLTLAVVADGQQALLAAYRTAARWLWKSTQLELSILPGCWYEGEITALTVGELTDAYMTFSAVFRANPPYLMHAQSQTPGFIPSGETPIAEQITAETQTCSGAFTASGTLPTVTLTGMEEPALYMMLAGTWDALSVGQLTITQAAAQATSLYIDCENQQVYTITSGSRVTWMGSVSGDFPRLESGVALSVGGTNINVTARALVIERG